MTALEPAVDTVTEARRAFILEYVQPALAVIAAIRARFVATPFWRAALEIMLGGVLVRGAGMLIGSA